MKCKNPIVMTYALDRRKSGILKAGWQFAGYYKSLKAEGALVPEMSYLPTTPDGMLLYPSGKVYDTRDYGKQMLVPCGQCYSCKIARSREWATRCVLEARAFGLNNCFITLTYNDENLPADLSLHKEDFQKFMKRLRKYSGKKIRYYMCGEYGETYGRPHYHACLFGYKPDDLQLWSVNNGVNLYRSSFLEKCWPFGFVTVGEVTYESAAYVARYVLKKMTGDLAQEHYGDKLPEYTNMSLKPGIGQSYFEKYSEEIYNRDFVIIRDGIKCKIPLYFDKIYDRYYGDKSFKNTIKAKRAIKSYVNFKRLPVEYSVSRIIDRGDAVEVAARKKLQRKLEAML